MISKVSDDQCLNANDLLNVKSKIKKIFFLRICGMGMGTTATLLRQMGLEVAGCDVQFYPPMGQYLKDLQVTCYKQEEFSKELIQQYDLVVIGNSVSEQSKDVQILKESKVPYCSFPAALGAFVLKDREVIGVAGTHGKTTSTYYLVQVLAALGEDPGYLVGGVLPDRKASSLGTSKYFVIESDEYESSFFEKFSKLRLYHIKKMLLMALEYDHADVFKSIEDIKNQFKEVVSNVSLLVFNGAYQAARELAQVRQKDLEKISLYYNDQDIKTGPTLLEATEQSSRFKLFFKGEWLEFTTNILGPQNIQNLSAVILFCLQEGFQVSNIRSAISNLSQVKRRQEVRGQYGSLTVIDDFAHHPTSVALTLASIKQRFPDRPIHVVFEAITSTARSNAFQKEFAQAFKLASSVLVVNPQVPTNASQWENLDYSLLSKELASQGIWSFEFKELAPLRAKIDEWSKSSNPSVLAVFSNRTVLGLWESDFVINIKK